MAKTESQTEDSALVLISIEELRKALHAYAAELFEMFLARLLPDWPSTKGNSDAETHKDTLITRMEASLILRRVPQTLDRWAREGKLHRVYKGRKIYFRKEEVQEVYSKSPESIVQSEQ